MSETKQESRSEVIQLAEWKAQRQQEERRQKQRLLLSRAVVGEIDLGDLGKSILIELVNVNEEGCSFKFKSRFAQFRLPIGAALKVRFNLAADVCFEAHFQVVHVTESGDLGRLHGCMLVPGQAGGGEVFRKFGEFVFALAGEKFVS